MTLTEAVSGSKKPTLLELQTLVQAQQEELSAQKQSIAQLESENTALHSALQQAQQAKDEAFKILTEQNQKADEERKTQEASKGISVRSLLGFLHSYMRKQWFPFASAALTTALAAICSHSLWNDFVRIWNLLLSIAELADSALSVTSEISEALPMLLTTVLGAIGITASIWLIIRFLKVARSVYNTSLRISIGAVPLLFFTGDFWHTVCPSINLVLLYLMFQVLLTLLLFYIIKK